MSIKNKMTIETKLRLLMLFLVLTLVSFSILSFWSSHKFVDQINDLGEVQLPGVSNISLADMMHDGIRANVNHAILIAKTNDPEERKEVKEESVQSHII